jgi:beta-phosphoglucomutase
MIDKIGALFDLDGVIMDTESKYTEFWDEIERRYPTRIPNFSQVIKGSNLKEILDTHYPTQEIRDEVAKLLFEFQKSMKYEYFDGAMDFIKALNKQNIPVCVVTSSDQKKMEALYEQHPDFLAHFTDVVTGEMVKKPKPAPECFLFGAKLIKREPKDCYIFEDSVNGLQAAKASGAHVIGLATTNPRDAIKKYADKIIDNFIGFTVEDMLSTNYKL